MSTLPRGLSAILLSWTLLLPSGLHAQGIEGDLAGLAEENASLYVQPLARGLGFAMAGGLFDGARPLGRFGFDVGIRVTGAFPPTEAETFFAVLPGSVQWGAQTYQNPYVPANGTGETPTAVGEGPGVVLEPSGDFRNALILSGRIPSDYEIEFPEGLDIPAVPSLVAHGSLGVGFGTEVSVRFIPEITVDDEIGGISARGFAVRHELTNWFLAPVDLSVVLGTQSLDIGDYLEASSTQYGVILGRSLGPLSLFASGIARSATVEVGYTVDNPDDENPALPPHGTRITFEEKLDSGLALGLGARLSLLFMNLSGQYVLDDYNALSLKLGFGMP